MLLPTREYTLLRPLLPLHPQISPPHQKSNTHHFPMLMVRHNTSAALVKIINKLRVVNHRLNVYTHTDVYTVCL